MKYDKKSIEARKQNNKIAKKIIDIILIILAYNIILVAISNINTENGMSLFGCEAYIIKTNSMEPSIKNGDVVITKKVPEEKIQVGDIITFKQDADIITHRISRIEEENENQKKEEKKELSPEEIEEIMQNNSFLFQRIYKFSEHSQMEIPIDPENNINLKNKIKQGEITSKEAKKYLAGHMGYIQIADVKNLTDKLFYIEEVD